MVTTGYNKASIVAHWIAAVCIIALFVTHEGERGSLERMFHISGGAIIGIFLLWRVLRRPVRGFTDKPDQHPLFNLASQLVLWGLLISIVLVTLSGYFLPWSRGGALDMFGLFAIPSPIPSNHTFHELLETVHDVGGHVIMLLFIIHLVGALKHRFVDKDNIVQRIIRPVTGGR